MVCWQCEAPLGADEVTCSTCGVVQPPQGLDPFTRLGLTPDARLTTADIAARRLELLDRLHPDRFAAHSPTAGAHALALATAINDAARALRDPIDRLTLLLRMRGIEAEPARPTPAFLGLIQEFEAAIGELAGVDAHDERDRIGRQIAHRFQAAQDILASELEGPDFHELFALRSLGELVALRGLIERLEALDTTPDRLGRRRR